MATTTAHQPVTASDSRTPAEPPPPPPTRQLGPIALLLCLGLVLNLFSGAAKDLGLPISLDRPVLLLALVLLVAAKQPQWRRTPLLAVMLLTVVWTAWSWAATGSLSDTAKAFALVDRIVVPFLMFVVGAAVFDTPARRDLLLKVLSLIGIYLGLTGLFQYLGRFNLIFPSYARVIDDRPTGPFYPAYEALGMACDITMVAAVVLVVRGRGLWRLVGLASAPISLVGVVICQTRSTWIAAAAAIVLLPLLVARLRKWIVLVWVVVAGVAAGAAHQFPGLVEFINDRADQKGSVYDRVLSNAGGVRAVLEHPLNGVGWQNFQADHSTYVYQLPTIPFTNVDIEIHDVFLSRAAETGLVGAALWVLAVVMGPIAALLIRPRTPEMVGWRVVAAGAFLAWLVPSLVSPNSYPFPNYVFWLVCGIVAGPLMLVRSGRPFVRRRREPVDSTAT